MRRLKKRLETLYNNPTEYRNVYAECYGSTVNKGKQARHLFGYDKLKENSSYFKNDLETLQKIVDEKAGKGVVSLTKRNLTEIIQDDRLKGFDFNLDKHYQATNKAKIHYSKTGVHLVPTLKELKND